MFDHDFMVKYALMFVVWFLGAVSCRAREHVDPFVADCHEWCSKRLDCGAVVVSEEIIGRCADDCVDAKELDAPEHGPTCVRLYKEAMACLANLSCEEYVTLTYLPETNQPCAESLDPFYEQCPGVFLAPDTHQMERP